jgi:hypothetical protein
MIDKFVFLLKRFEESQALFEDSTFPGDEYTFGGVIWDLNGLIVPRAHDEVTCIGKIF